MAYSRLSPNDSRHARSSVVTALAFHRGGVTTQETRDGACVYSGDASQYHEWEFKTRLKLTGCTKDFFPKTMAQVISGLRGDAFTLASRIGAERLFVPPKSLPDKFRSAASSEVDKESEQADGAASAQASMRPSTTPGAGTGFLTEPAEELDGMETLFAEIKKMVFPQTTHESRDLFKEYNKPSGILARHHGEAMHLYVVRRRRAW